MYSKVNKLELKILTNSALFVSEASKLGYKWPKRWCSAPKCLYRCGEIGEKETKCTVKSRINPNLCVIYASCEPSCHIHKH